MGLTGSSSGLHAVDNGLIIQKQNESEKIIALAGNPNVGKSTVFNELTGMNQHTGNWPGKTVASAQGTCIFNNILYHLVDIPGTYSLMAHSAEEEVARDFICFGGADAVIVVCDATCLERNLNLVLQTAEICGKVIVCINLMDEAEKKNINIDLDGISKELGLPVVGITARSGKGLDKLMESVENALAGESKPAKIKYIRPIEDALEIVTPEVQKYAGKVINPRWLALKLLQDDTSLINSANDYLKIDLFKNKAVISALDKAKKMLFENNISDSILKDRIAACFVLAAEGVCADTVVFDKAKYNSTDRKLDKIITGKLTGYPIMLALLAVVFWITLTGANYPSQLLSNALFWIEERLTDFFINISAPPFLYEMLVHGIYRVLAWVISVMLPPMAIFFPLFTLLEDSGFLPRVAFNLDKYFNKCNACGKQSLTMCMGFGCNAAGVVGCRIIDSPRERMIAILTNNFVPCNGRFPTLIAIISMFFISFSGIGGSVVSALLVTTVILLGIFMTFLSSKLLSKTVLKGVPSSFTLELPPYRRPQLLRVIIRSVKDRTLYVLARAAMVAAPAGLLIWLTANIYIGGSSILSICTEFLDPFGKLIGLDGVIVMAFILGFPANEIVVPIIIMAYTANGTLTEYSSLFELKNLLIQNNWTMVTAICFVIFMLMHWPCSTTLLTIKKETGSIKWTALAFILPTAFGILLCFLINTFSKFIM